jgi:hypothetical protein
VPILDPPVKPEDDEAKIVSTKRHQNSNNCFMRLPWGLGRFDRSRIYGRLGMMKPVEIFYGVYYDVFEREE